MKNKHQSLVHVDQIILKEFKPLVTFETYCLGEITLCPPLICPKNTLPISGLKIGTLST